VEVYGPEIKCLKIMSCENDIKSSGSIKRLDIPQVPEGQLSSQEELCSMKSVKSFTCSDAPDDYLVEIKFCLFLIRPKPYMRHKTVVF
jgi:hypothetical protein